MGDGGAVCSAFLRRIVSSWVSRILIRSTSSLVSEKHTNLKSIDRLLGGIIKDMFDGRLHGYQTIDLVILF